MSREIAKRRDRRKAKQSEWTRPGISNPRKVGHGGAGQVTSKVVKRLAGKQIEQESKAPPLKASIIERIK